MSFLGHKLLFDDTGNAQTNPVVKGGEVGRRGGLEPWWGICNITPLTSTPTNWI